MNYEVGQILYTIIKEKQLIVPVKVIEQIITKNLESEKTEYKVLLPNSKNQKVSLSKFENVFEDIDKVNDYLLDKAKASIEKMSEDALELEIDFFPSSKSIDKTNECKNENVDNKINGHQKITLDDGTVANIIDNTEKELINEKDTNT
jgi:hypothetical protein